MLCPHLLWTHTAPAWLNPVTRLGHLYIHTMHSSTISLILTISMACGNKDHMCKTQSKICWTHWSPEDMQKGSYHSTPLQKWEQVIKVKKKKKVYSVRNILNLYIKSSRKKRQVFMTTSHAPVHYYCHTASNIGQKSSTVYITTS